jgi:hypothetical protein
VTGEPGACYATFSIQLEIRMFTKTISLAILALTAAAAGAQDMNYVFYTDQVTGAPGATVTIPVRLDNTGGEIQAWSVGLSVPAPLEILDFRMGPDTAQFNNGAGPQFYGDAVYPGVGVTVGVVIDFQLNETLAPGIGYVVHEVDVRIPAGADPGTQYQISFVDTIGSPPVVNLVVVDVSGFVPVQLEGSVVVELGAPFCFCDGSGALPPCGNAAGPDEGCANSTGGGARLTAFGSSSASADTLVFQAANLLPGQPALLFVGNNSLGGGNGIPFGDGLRCAGNSVVRLGVAFPDSAGAATWGPGLGVAGGWGQGDTRRFQSWYRDPGASPCGSGFNLTHGVELTFGP